MTLARNTGHGSPEAPGAPVVGGHLRLSALSLLRDWMGPRLAARDIDQATLARDLGVQTPQVNSWLGGTQPITRGLMTEVARVLRLSHDEFLEFVALTEAVERLNDLARLFVVQLRRSKAKSSEEDLQAYFRRPALILDRLVRHCAKLVDNDHAIYPSSNLIELLNIHMQAAARCCADLNAFLTPPKPGREEVRLFNPLNIRLHLRAPHHHYISFFLTECSREDGDNVKDLQDQVEQELVTYLTDLESSDAVSARIAQHGVHLLSRYRGHPVTAYLKSKSIETRRMAYFGGIFGLEKNAPFEEAAKLMIEDKDFGENSLSFDGIHYGDYSSFADRKNQEIVPIRALLRYINSLTHSEASIRHISCACILNLLERHERRIRGKPEHLEAIAEKRAVIEAFESRVSSERTARARLLSLLRPSGPGAT